MKKYSIGNHQRKVYFNCLECAIRYYKEIKDKNKFLMNEYENEIILNTYGWFNTSKELLKGGLKR